MFRFSRALVLAALSASTIGLSFGGATAHADQPSVYVVKQGDSLFGIANKLKVTLDSLLTTNGITVTSVILPGQQLQVPGAGGGAGNGSAGPSASSASYTVKAGDSLSRIAQRTGVSLAALLAVNSMTVTSLILPGQTLALPAGATAPAATQQPAAQQPPAASGATYTVKAGDSLSAIAQRSGVKLTALLTANAITVTSLIVPGQVLKLPAGATAPAVAAQPAAQPGAQPAAAGGPTYTIKAGDSLSAIAQRHNVTLTALLMANKITATSLILPGQTLVLPAGATLVAATPTGSTSVSNDVATVLAYAQAQLGKGYQFNTAGPDTFDCSGLTKAAYRTVGVSLVHQSASQARQGTAVDFINEQIRPGDLVFLATGGSTVVNHVGIAVSNTQYIHAASPADGVKLSKMPAKGAIVAVRRMIPS